MNLSIEKSFNKSLNSEILINIDLNQKEEKLNEIIQQIEYEDIKKDSLNICKNCLYKYCDIDNSICKSCDKIQFNSRISTTFLFSGLLTGTILSIAVFSLSSASSISIGLCSGNVIKCIYDIISYGFIDIKFKHLKNYP